jgi:hypothetical protein
VQVLRNTSYFSCYLYYLTAIQNYKTEQTLIEMEFTTLKSQLPTKEWRIEMEEDQKDDDLDPDEIKFNEVILTTVDSILNNYISDMESLAPNNVTEESIKKEIKKVVLALNDFDEIRHFIDTGQREDLCEFIDKVITATGYKIPDHEDYTLEWRAW